MVENELASKGRRPRVWHLYEREMILEHMTRCREKLGLSMTQFSDVRAGIHSADSASALQSLVEGIYIDNKLRRSLLNFVAGKYRAKDSEPKFAMLGVTNDAKARFMQAKPDNQTTSDFLDYLMDLHDAKKH